MLRIPFTYRPWWAIVFLLLASTVRAEDESVLPTVMPEGMPDAAAAASVADVPADGRPEPVHPCRTQEVTDPRWFDRAQGYFSQQACRPVTWFDRFFAGEHTDDHVATALLRVVPSIQFSERDFTDSGVRVRARVNLPNLRERVNLVVNDDSDEQEGLLRGETQRPKQANAPTQESSAALRYLVRLTEESGADIDVGLRGKVKFFTRARYYYAWQHSPVLESRLTQSLYFLDGDGFGETSLYEVERMLAEDMLLRWSTQVTLSEELNGLEMREGLQLLRQIDRRRAISWGVAMTARSEPVWQATAYATSVRFRQNAFRPWFYFEVEPFVDAGRADKFSPNPGIAFRVEFLIGDFGEKGKKARAAPAPAKQPAAIEPAISQPLGAELGAELAAEPSAEPGVAEPEPALPDDMPAAGVPAATASPEITSPSDDLPSAGP